MKALFTADLHLTSAPQDEYRWEIFPWLDKQIDHRHVDILFLLGDLTDRKDHHPAKLTNRLVENLIGLASRCKVVILRGNHDYVDPETPYFKFLSRMKNTSFYNEPGEFEYDGYKFLCLPHTDSYRSSWKGWRKEAYEFVLLHQAITGAQVHGYKIEGAPSKIFDQCEGFVLAGDVHVPQQIGNVIYCGAPHPIDFGDDYEPRVLYYDGEKLKSLRHYTIRKAVVRTPDPEALQKMVDSNHLRPGDQVRVILVLAKSMASDWSKLRDRAYAIAKEAELHVRSIEVETIVDKPRLRLGEKRQEGLGPVETFDLYCESQEVEEEVARVGRKIVERCLRQ